MYNATLDAGMKDDTECEEDAPGNILFIPQNIIDYENGINESDMQNALTDAFTKAVNRTNHIRIKKDANMQAFIKEHAHFFETGGAFY